MSTLDLSEDEFFNLPRVEDYPKIFTGDLLSQLADACEEHMREHMGMPPSPPHEWTDEEKCELADDLIKSMNNPDKPSSGIGGIFDRALCDAKEVYGE